jgi:N-acetyl-gamma-glutamyl-phosphate reductase
LIEYVHSRSNAGKALHQVHNDLLGDTDLAFSNEIHFSIDILFLCVGYGEAISFLEEHRVPANLKIIDLSHDFRLQGTRDSFQRHFVYGLPELNREEIKNSLSLANPGCFATCIQLGLLPLANEHLLSSVHTTGITGSTGAGQSFQATSHFSWRANNVQPYKSLSHQHVNEIIAALQQLQPSEVQLNFLPWRGDFTRGIIVSSYLDCDLEEVQVRELFSNYYTSHPFVHISEQMIDLKQIVNTNKCVIFIEKQGSKIIVHSAIDNLLKGASGQAVQNMNLMFGLPETTGLLLKASKF